jgi:hypothetical protein
MADKTFTITKDGDRIRITVLADGTIKSVTESISMENHQSAEGFFDTMARLTGGKTTMEPRGDHERYNEDLDQHIHQSN